MFGIKLENVTRRFDNVLALDRINLEIDAGEFFFLLGPSGCGKTTLLRILAGFDQPETGRVFFDGRDVTAVPPHERNTGMVFQNYALWPHMTVWKNVEYGLTMRNMPQHERDQKVRARSGNGSDERLCRAVAQSAFGRAATARGTGAGTGHRTGRCVVG